MQKLTTIEEVRAWVENNSNHPEFQNVCDELALLEALNVHLHQHNSIEGARHWFESIPSNVRIAAEIEAQVDWVTNHPDQEFNKDQARLEFIRKIMDEHRKDEEAQGIEEPHFDKNYDCPTDREIRVRMEPSFKLINTYINGKESRRHQTNAIQVDGKGGIS